MCYRYIRALSRRSDSWTLPDVEIEPGFCPSQAAWDVMAGALCLDLRGLKCPLPALMARRRLARLAAGSHLTVLADDPLAAVDIPHMCNGEGHEVIAVNKQDGHTTFEIRRAGPTDRSDPAG